ncbi:hypothetical protein [Endozoicomonas sp. ALB032]|uniref:hypothetical protein n=1 Tax=Endozoicomonas sp. ALB032 TaxID=3403082 RepID=UPI003BB60BC9
MRTIKEDATNDIDEMKAIRDQGIDYYIESVARRMLIDRENRDKEYERTENNDRRC